ncbi:hypothetical protein Tco_1172254, partial [Tanacetum coccineum]
SYTTTTSSSAQDGNVGTRLVFNRFGVLSSNSLFVELVNTNMLASLRCASPVPYVQTEVAATAVGPAYETGASSALGHETRASSFVLGGVSLTDECKLDKCLCLIMSIFGTLYTSQRKDLDLGLSPLQV